MRVFDLARRRGFPVDRSALQKTVVKSLTSLGDLRDLDQCCKAPPILIRRRHYRDD